MARGSNGTPKRRSKKDWSDRFLKRLAKTGNIKAACCFVKIGRTTFYRRRDEDAAFAAMVRDALDDGCDDLELEARRRAHDGLPRKKFTGKGEPVIDPKTGKQYVEHEYSDTLLIFLLKAHRPDVYRENVKVEHGGVKGQPIQHEHRQHEPDPGAFAAFMDGLARTRSGSGLPPLPADHQPESIHPAHAAPETGSISPQRNGS